MKTTFSFILLFLYSVCLIAQNRYFDFYTDSGKLKADNNALIQEFEKLVRKIKSSITLNGAETIVENGSPTGYYLTKTNNIYLPWWGTMPTLFKDFGNKVAGGKKEGDELAKLFYYGYFLPHEVGHALQFNANKRFDNEYDNEYEANVLALLYWRQKGRHKELKRCYEIATQVLKNLPDPIPKGEDPKTYFTKNYDVFLQDPEKYGYIMFYQVARAYEDKKLTTFDNYIRLMLSR